MFKSKHINTLLAVLLGLTISACSAQGQNEAVRVLGAEEFHQQIKNNEDVQLIDVRTADEYAKGHIPNSSLLDYLNGDFEKATSNLNKGQAVYLYCASGNRSGKAAKLLKERGFKEVYDLEGGYNAWPYKEKQ